MKLFAEEAATGDVQVRLPGKKAARPRRRASSILVGKEHETVVLTKGKDGKDSYKVIVNTAYLKQAAATQ